MPDETRSVKPQNPNVHWVKPNLPTALSHLERLQIPGTDLIFPGIDAGWVFPGSIDLGKLKKALARTLTDYPHGAGRLRCDDGIWTIALTNSAVPITVGSSDLVITDEFMHERHPNFLDPLPWSFAPVSNVDEPLIRFKLVTWPKTGDSSLSISFCHLLGDGYTLYQFMNSLSFYYLDLKPQFVPSFEKYLQPPPKLERHLVRETIPLVPHLVIDYDADTFFTMYSAMMESTSRIDLQFTAQQLDRMRAAASLDAGKQISTQDALVAYLIAVLNRVQKEPINQIMNVVDYRGVPPAGPSNYIPPPPTAIGNITLTSFSPKMLASANTLGKIATVVRDTVTQTRQPESVRRAVALSEELYTRSSNTGRLQWWWPYEGGVGVNNVYKLPVTSIHFGYKDKTRFYTYDSWERYFRLWPGNPERRLDGTWEVNAGSARVFFRVKHALKPRFLKIVEEDLKVIARAKL